MRPWTLGPWDGFEIRRIGKIYWSRMFWYVPNYFDNDKKIISDIRLAAKSLEMAELLIDLAKLDGAFDEYGIYAPFCERAKELLKEVGYKLEEV